MATPDDLIAAVERLDRLMLPPPLEQVRPADDDLAGRDQAHQALREAQPAGHA